MSAGDDIERVKDAVEEAVHALLPLVPLAGSWDTGYRVDTVLPQATLTALPSEWAEAAHAVSELHALIPALDRLQGRLAAGNEIIERLIEAGVERWHETADDQLAGSYPSDDLDLAAWLGLTADEYSVWVEGDASSLVAARAALESRP